MKNETTSLIASETKYEETRPQAASRQPPCVWPRDSIIEDYMLLARKFCEAEDQLLAGAFLPALSAALGRNVYINFGGRMFPNVYCILVSRAGMQTSTTAQLVTHIARGLLPEEAFFSGVTSTQALFLEYLTHPDKLWLIDEDVVLNNWACDPAGKGVARQLLTLYDCPPWRESYLKHKKGDGEAIQEVSQTSTSTLIGATPSSARFSALETRAGMRQRFNYYLSERFGRMIPWPLAYDSRELVEFTRTLAALKSLKGEMRLSVEARELWKHLQVENRRQIEAVKGIDAASETYSAMLAASPVKTLKLGMLFQICRWVKDKTLGWQIIQADTLDLASRHEAGCVAANKALLDGTANRAEIQDEADAIDTLNREADRICQERYRHYEPDVAWVKAKFAEPVVVIIMLKRNLLGKRSR